ncbi:unnamed protein product [Sympodiomycopsis kandeliae]
MVVDYYSILDISPDSDTTTITRAYRSRALKTHPDRRGGNEAEFKLIAEAYEVLSDRRKRLAYDQQRSPQRHHQQQDLFDPFGAGLGFSSGSSFSTSFGHNRMDARDLFDRMFSDLNRFHAGSSDPFFSSLNPQFDHPPMMGSGTSILDSMFGPGGHHTFSQDISRSSSPGVTSRINEKTGNMNCSFSTSFGSSHHTTSSNDNSRTQSYTTSTRVMNGQRQEYSESVDAQGNSNVRITAPDGTVKVYRNGQQVDANRRLPSSGNASQVGSRSKPVVIE